MKRHIWMLLVAALSFALYACDSGGGGTDEPECGNGILEEGETCDGTQLGGQTCEGLANFTGGELACTADCTLDTSGCTAEDPCGNESIDAGEDCDGANLGGATCATEGMGTGTLACNDDCSFDYSGCEEDPCGNGVIDAGEDCDGTNLNDMDCTDAGDFDGGTLACNDDCTFNTEGCTIDPCGNGDIDGDEQCDGTNLNDTECADIDGFIGGTLACNDDCTFDTASCEEDPCGNGTIDGSEECDGTEFGDATCLSEGFAGGGTLACNDDCTFDFAGCFDNPCGNGVLDDDEECDNTNLNDTECADIEGFIGGTLACSNDCTFDTSGCEEEPCGNGNIDGDEDCDGTNLNTRTCLLEGYSGGGVLACNDDCTFNYGGCFDDPCGNGAIDGDEDCDGGNLNDTECAGIDGFISGTLACNDDCTFDTTNCVVDPCGNGTIDDGEDCDGTELGDATCLSEDFAGGGTLSCNDDCTFDTTGCFAHPCGNGVLDEDEDCDDTLFNETECANLEGFLSGTLACNQDCTYDTAGCVIDPCGNGTIDDGEDCDGTNLNEMGCGDVAGFAQGTLACNDDCTFNTEGCLEDTCAEDMYEAYENDDLASAVGPMTAGTSDLWLCNEGAVGEEDWFFMDLAANDVLVARMTFNNDFLNIDGFLFDATGAVLESSESTNDVEEIIYVAGDAAETVYLAAIPYDNEDGYAPYTASVWINPACTDDEGCGAEEICVDFACVPGCRVDDDCTTDGEICLDEACVPGCRLDDDCGDGEVCFENACITPDCLENANCAFGEACVDYACVMTACTEDADCADFDLVCLVDQNVCVQCNAATDCPTDEFMCTDNFCVVDCMGDAYEPNGTQPEAAAITAPIDGEALTLCDLEADDWFVIDLPALTRIDVDIAFTDDNGDVDLFLYAANSEDFDEDDLASSTGTDDAEDITWDVDSQSAGLYYIRVMSWSSYHGGDYQQDYTLTVTTTALGCAVNTDCALGEVCDDTNTCLATTCTADADCDTYDLVCDTANGYCVECVDADDCDDYYGCVDNFCAFDCTDDAYEPNDVMDDALEIIPSTYEMMMCDEFGDADDWFTFNLTAGDIFAAGAWFDDDVVDINLRLVDADDGFLASSTSSTADYEEIIYTADADMAVFLRVYSNSASESSGPYELTVDVNPDCTIDDECGEGFICLGFACVPGCREDAQCDGGEVCFDFECIVPECVEHSDCVSGQACVDYACQSTVCTEDADCDDFDLMCDTTNGYCVECLAVGDCPNDTDFSCDGGFCALDCVEDAYEPNDSANSAAPITVPFDQTGLTLCGNYEQDWYAVAYEAHRLYQIDAIFTDSVGDIDLYLYDETGELIASATSYDDNETLTVGSPGMTGTVYLLVDADEYSGYVNTYDLTIADMGAIDCAVDEECGDREFCNDDYMCEAIPAGEDCADPIVIETLPFYDNQDLRNFGPDIETPEGGCTGAYYVNRGADVIYEITLEAGDVLYAIVDGDYDEAIYLVDQCVAEVPASSCLAGEDNGGTGEEFTWTATAAGTYYIVVDYYSSTSTYPYSGGIYDLTVIVNAECMDDTECTTEGDICLDYVCTPGCRLDADCTTEGDICLENTCQPGCRTDEDCEAPLVCDETFQCVVAGCTTHADCGLGQACDNLQCVVTSCTEDADCTQYDMVCDEGLGACLECIEDADCTTNDYACTDNFCVLDCVDDMFEENDDPLSATPGAAGAFSLMLCEADGETEQDWFSIALQAGETIGVYAVFLDDDANLDLRLYDESETLLDSSTSYTDDEQVSYVATEAMTVYLLVDSVGTDSAAYDLIVAIDPGCLEDDDCVAGNICTQMECVPGCRTDGNCPVGEVCLNEECIVPACLDEADCAAGEACVDYACVATTCTDGGGECDEYDLICDTANGYCVQCLDVSDCLSATDFICDAGLCVLQCTEDTYESNGEERTAATLTLPVDETALTLCGSAAQDWFVFDLEALTTYQFDVLFTHADGDIDVYLYAAEDTSTYLLRGYSSSDDENFSYTAPAAGTYYLKVLDYSSTYTQSYDLQIASTGTVECMLDEHCTTEGEICLEQVCTPGCRTADDCPAGDICGDDNQCFTPLEGDSCANAILIDALPFTDTDRDISGYTDQVRTNDCLSYRPLTNRDVVYEAYVVEGTTYNVVATPTFDAVIFIVNDCGENVAGACVAYEDDPEDITLTPGEGQAGTYYVVVEPYSSSVSSGTFTLEASVVTP